MNAAPDSTSVIRHLYAAAGHGWLTIDEADRRIAAARSTSAAADLSALVSDLPQPFPPAAPVWGPRALPPDVEAYPGSPQAPIPRAVGDHPDRPLEIDGLLAVVRTGAWVVPPYLRVKPGFFATVLDFSAAQVSPVTHVEVVPGLGVLLLMVPRTWGVDVRGLTGRARNRALTEPAPGAPVIMVTGDTGWLGAVSVTTSGGSPARPRAEMR